MHLESAFVRLFNRGASGTLDIIHNFNYHYNFMNPPRNETGLRAHAAAGGEALAVLRKEYDAALFIDIPIKMHRLLLMVRTLCAAKADKFFFVANHLAPDSAKLRSAKIAEEKKLLARFTAGFLLEFEDLRLWTKMGLPLKRQLLRPYCIDCNYYSPAEGEYGDYIISAGSTGRDFTELFAAVEGTPFNLKIISNSTVTVPPSLRKRVEALPFNNNIARIKDYISASAGAVIPVKDEHQNPTAGMAITFMAMACGKAAVCRKTDWMARYVRNGENGFMYPSLTAKNLRRILLELAALSPEQKTALGAKARKTMLETANLDTNAETITAKITAAL